MKGIIVKYIFSYLSAVYFLVAGVGYNVVNYCCQLCENEGIEMVAVDSCFAVHHHPRIKNYQEQHGDLFCADFNQHINNCQFIRLNTDIPSFQAMYKLYLQQICTVHLFDLPYTFFAEKNNLFKQFNIPPPEDLLFKSGRYILIFNAILLI